MFTVIFVVPFAMETSLRFVRSVVRLPGVRLGVISQGSAADLGEEVYRHMDGFRRVEDALDAATLERAVHELGRKLGGQVDRLIGVLEQLQEPMAAVRQRLGIRGMDPEEAANFRDKSRMKDLLRRNDLPCARHRLATSAKEALAFADVCLPLVVKPPAGAGARNTLRVDTRADLEGYLRTMPPDPKKPLLLEEFVVGREHSFDSVSLGGEHVFHSISRYHPTPLEVMEKPWLQWCVVLPREIDGPEFDDIRVLGRRVLDVLGMVTGMTHMEWFRRDDGSVAISEVAARPPGAQFTSLISYAHDMDFYRAWAELVVFERFAPPPRRHAVGAVFLRGQGGGRVARIRGVEEAAGELGDLVVQARLPEPGQRSADTYEGEGFVILRHAETAVVERGLARLIQLIKVDMDTAEATP